MSTLLNELDYPQCIAIYVTLSRRKSNVGTPLSVFLRVALSCREIIFCGLKKIEVLTSCLFTTCLQRVNFSQSVLAAVATSGKILETSPCGNESDETTWQLSPQCFSALLGYVPGAVSPFNVSANGEILNNNKTSNHDKI